MKGILRRLGTLAVCCCLCLGFLPGVAGAEGAGGYFYEDPRNDIRFWVPEGWEVDYIESTAAPCHVITYGPGTNDFVLVHILSEEGDLPAGLASLRKDLQRDFPTWPNVPHADGVLSVSGLISFGVTTNSGNTLISYRDTGRYIVLFFPASFPENLWDAANQIIESVSTITDTAVYSSSEDDYTFEPFEDGVVVTAYTGDSYYPQVPDTFGGKPVVAIGEKAFYETISLRVKLPDTVRTIGLAAFSGCNYLYTINYPASLKAIGPGAFESCYTLASNMLPEGLLLIDHAAFWGCMSLKSVLLPVSLEILGDSVFYLCKSLAEILVPEESESFTVKDGVLFTKDMKGSSPTHPRNLIWTATRCPMAWSGSGTARSVRRI